MRKSVETTKTDEASLAKEAIDLGLYHLWKAANRARPYLGGRRGLILLAVAVLGAGAALNWGWLIAIGVAPILVSLAPCAAMCAIGACCMKGGGKSCSSDGQRAKGGPGTDLRTEPREDA